MATINITADVQSVVLAAEAMTKALGKSSAGVKELALQSAKYDANGQLLSATLKGIDSTGRAFTATAKLMGGQLVIMGTQFTDVANKVKGAKDQIGDLSRSINSLSQMFQRFVVNKALNTMTDSLKEGFNAAKDFQVQISQIRGISQDAQLNFNGWAQGLKQVSDQLGFSLEDTTKAAYDAISNQVTKGAETFGFLKDAGDLARVNMGATLDQSVNLLSSAINAYNLSASDATELSALFFATIDEGRVTMKDMADTLGRVAILAKGLDIPINELAASIAFLTQKGVTTDDAFTFMRNVFVQLQKPSEQLSAFFRSIGVESGKAAIQTYGFMGILQKIKDQVNSGDLEVAKLFPEIRAQQPIQAALNDFAGYERIVNKFRDTGGLIEKYNKAIELRAESPADYINKEFNKIKNTFTVDLGQKLVGFAKEMLVGLSQINKMFGGDGSLTSGLKMTIVLFRDLTLGIIAFRTASAIATSISLGHASALAVQGAVATKTAAQIAAANVAMRANLIGALAFVGTIVASRKTFGTDISSTNDGYQNTLEQLKEMRDEYIKIKAAKESIPKGPIFENTSRDSFQTILQGLAQFSIQSEATLSKARQNTKNATEDFKNAFQTYTDNLKDIGRELAGKIKENETVIKDSAKNIESYRQSLEDTINDIRSANAVGETKIDFLNQLQQETKDRAIQLFQGSPEEIKEAERLFGKVRDIERQKFDYNQQYFKEQRQKAETQDPSLPKLDDVAYKNKALEDSIELQRTLNDLNSEYKALVDGVVEKKKEELAKQKELQDTQKLNLRTLEDKFKAYNEFSPFSEGGVDAKYKNQLTGRVNIKAAQEDFDRISNELRTSVAASGDVAGRIQLENTIAERRKQLLAELGAAERVEVVRLTQTKTAAAEKDLSERLRNNKVEVENRVNLQKSILEKHLINPEDLTKTVDKAQAYIKRANLDSSGNIQFREETRLRQDRARDLINKYSQALEKAKTDQEEFEPGKFRAKSKNLIELQYTVRDVKESLKALFQPIIERSGAPGGYESQQLPGATGKQSFGMIEEVFDKNINELLQSQGELGSLKSDKDFLQTDFNKKIAPLMEELKGINPQVFKDIEAANLRATSATVATADAMLQLREAIGLLKGSLQNIPSPTNPVNTREPIFGLPAPTGIVEAGYGKPSAFGGWVGRPSSVIGPDKYHMVLGDGEHVTNAESASMYADVLTGINKDRRGINRDAILGGNMSSTNIGDINIIVNESKDGQETGRQVWTKLRREFRRGNITPRN